MWVPSRDPRNSTPHQDFCHVTSSLTVPGPPPIYYSVPSLPPKKPLISQPNPYLHHPPPCGWNSPLPEEVETCSLRVIEMEGHNNNSIIAPFVMKTYQMVNDPTTDMLISWGKANNSFLVVDPLDFSQRILPVYFKHNNFSSFVRQLNTYGFRKVDPDRWEFANEYFLRGQKQLLNNIVRRKHCKNSYLQGKSFDNCDDEQMLMEIARLKDEQKSLEQELEGMKERLESTERRPQQMMAFLYKMVEDPDFLPRMIHQKERSRQLSVKKPRLMIPSSSTSSLGMGASGSLEDEEVEGTVGVISSPETGLEVSQSSPSPETNPIGWLSQVNNRVSNEFMGYGGDRSGKVSYSGEIGRVESEAPPPPYPFSLLGGGFY